MSITRKALFTLAALGLGAFTAHPVSAQTVITGLFDTGVDAFGVSQANGTIGDQHYTLVSAPDSSSKQILIRTSAGGYPISPNGPYIGDSSTSAWIGPNNGTFSNDLAGPDGIYDYQTTFMASSAGAAIITGNWATDNVGKDILINGVSTGNVNNGQYSIYTPFTINATNLYLGANTIDFLVNNTAYQGDPDNPTALRVDGINASAAPEPSQIGMLALAALGLGALAVKARKRSTAAQAA